MALNLAGFAQVRDVISVVDQVLLEGLVLDLQILSGAVRNKHPDKSGTDQGQARSQDKDTSLPSKRVAVTKRLDRRLECSGAANCTNLANCGRPAVGCATDTCGVHLGGDKDGHVTGAVLAKGQKDAVKDHKQGEDLNQVLVKDAHQDSEHSLEKETKGHGPLAPDSVGRDGAKDAARHVHKVEQARPARDLGEGAVSTDGGVENGARKDAEGVGDKVVDEPGATGADQMSPVALDDQEVGHVAFDRVLLEDLRVGHPHTEVEDRES